MQSGYRAAETGGTGCPAVGGQVLITGLPWDSVIHAGVSLLCSVRFTLVTLL